MATDADYDDLMEQGRAIYPGVRIGRPARARSYWLVIAAMRALRLRWAVHVSGSEHVGSGAAILVGNHLSAMDPVVAVMSHWWRVTAFTKVEVYSARGAIFFRLMGQIPLRRGDEASTTWALAMATRALRDGGKLGLYPEGTRSPDHRTLHRLHKRILVPVLTTNPDVPVHAICTTYPTGGRWRRKVEIRLSPRLPIDPATMSPEQMADTVRDALIELGDLPFVDEYARDVKARSRPSA